MNDEELLGLTTEFRIKVREVLRICAQEGVTIHPYCGLRTCADQARLFRRSRSGDQVKRAAQSLRDRGYNFLAHSLIMVGPQPEGSNVTNAAPGESWHQFGMAVDCVPLVGGKALWEDSAKEWKIYGAAAEHIGLTWAGSWTSFTESPHIQMFPTKSPLSVYNPTQAETVLKGLGAI